MKGEHDVPLRLNQRRLLPGGRVPTPHRHEFAAFVGAVEQGAAVRRELMHCVADVAGMGREMRRRCAGGITVQDVDVVVGARVLAQQGHVPPVWGNGAQPPVGVVLEQQFPPIAFDGVAIEVEYGGIPFIGGHVEGVVGLRPTHEQGLQALAGGQVGGLAVRRKDVNVVQLVPLVVGGIQEPVVTREPGQRTMGTVRRVGQGAGRGAGYRQRIGVERA